MKKIKVLCFGILVISLCGCKKNINVIQADTYFNEIESTTETESVLELQGALETEPQTVSETEPETVLETESDKISEDNIEGTECFEINGEYAYYKDGAFWQNDNDQYRCYLWDGQNGFKEKEVHTVEYEARDITTELRHLFYCTNDKGDIVSVISEYDDDTYLMPDGMNVLIKMDWGSAYYLGKINLYNGSFTSMLDEVKKYNVQVADISISNDMSKAILKFDLSNGGFLGSAQKDNLTSEDYLLDFETGTLTELNKLFGEPLYDYDKENRVELISSKLTWKDNNTLAAVTNQEAKNTILYEYSFTDGLSTHSINISKTAYSITTGEKYSIIFAGDGMYSVENATGVAEKLDFEGDYCIKNSTNTLALICADKPYIFNLTNGNSVEISEAEGLKITRWIGQDSIIAYSPLSNKLVYKVIEVSLL